MSKYEFEHSHPHDKVVVNDLSTFSAIDYGAGGTKLLACGVTEKGEDGKLFKIDSLGDYLDQFGDLDFTSQGQSTYNVANWLTGGGSVLFMRLTADDAKYANAIVYANVKETEVQKENDDGELIYITDTGEETTDATDNTAVMIPKADIKITVETETDITSKSDLDSILDTSAFVDDVDGYTKYPLFAIYARGRGVYGNNTSFRLVPSDSSKANCPIYTLNVLTTSDGGQPEVEQREVAIDTRGIMNNGPASIRYILEKMPVNCKTVMSTQGISKVVSIMKNVANGSDLEYRNINFLTTDTSSPQCINVESSILDASYGVPLENGSDGSWDGDLDFTGDPSYGEKFADFYSGAIDGGILNTVETTYDTVLDANYPSEVKLAMVSLANERDDVTVWLDTGVVQTNSEAVMAKSNLNVSFKFNMRMVHQHKEIIDPYTSQFVTVTLTYLLASKIPNHVENVGYDVPMAGGTYGVLSSGVDLVPAVSSTDDQDKLYDEGIIYVRMENGDPVIQHEQTMQERRSYLSKGSNCEILSRIIKRCFKIGPQSRFETTDPKGLEKIVEQTNDGLLEFHSMVDFLEFKITQSERQRQLNILQRTIDVKFKDTVERNLFIVNVLPGGDK